MKLNSIAFIPDGNRRYFKSKGIMSVVNGYSFGTKKAWEVLDWLTDYPKIKFGTFYALSFENFQRRRLEVPVLLNIFSRELNKVKHNPFFEENGIKLNFIGRLELLPKSLRRLMNETTKITSQYKTKKTVNLAVAYGGQSEIIDATKKFALDFQKGNTSLKDLNEKSFANYLYSDFSPPDLMIRTSGVKRLSGFLQYQSAYSELCFVDKFWPEFSRQDLDKAINDFNSRERRFGK
ncbi:MAG: polyprenyl diphosphate synthase [archaeon]